MTSLTRTRPFHLLTTAAALLAVMAVGVALVASLLNVLPPANSLLTMVATAAAVAAVVGVGALSFAKLDGAVSAA